MYTKLCDVSGVIELDTRTCCYNNSVCMRACVRVFVHRECVYMYIT